jgi:hypothetical protein
MNCIIIVVVVVGGMAVEGEERSIYSNYKVIEQRYTNFSIDNLLAQPWVHRTLTFIQNISHFKDIDIQMIGEPRMDLKCYFEGAHRLLT